MRRDTRVALMEAAQERFAAHGFAGTSIRELARAVGIKESSVYNHFPSKQAIFDAVIERATGKLDAVAAHFGVPVDDAAAAGRRYDGISTELIDQIAFGYLDAWLHDQDVVAARRLLTLEQYRTPAAGLALHDLTVTGPLTFQTAVFDHLIRRGNFRPAEPRAVALAFWGPIMAMLAIADVDEAEARDLLSLHLDHFRATHLAASAPDSTPPLTSPEPS